MNFVYLAYTDLYVKIGRTANPKKRMSDLVSGCPLKLKIIFRRETPELNESSLHEKFREHRLHHEWFNYHNDIKKLVNFFEGKVEVKVKPFREKKRVNLYKTDASIESETTQEPVRIIKTSRVVDMLDTGESIRLKG